MKWVAELARSGGRLEDHTLYALLFAVEQWLRHPVQVSGDGHTLIHATNASIVGTVKQEKEILKRPSGVYEGRDLR